MLRNMVERSKRRCWATMAAASVCLSATLAVTPAHAADPTVAGPASIGAVGGAQSWWGLWPTQFNGSVWNNYTIISSTDTKNTYINSQPGGAIMFRSNNGGFLATDPDGWHSMAYLDQNGRLVVYGMIESSSGFTANVNSPSAPVVVYNQGAGDAIYGYSVGGTAVKGQATAAGDGTYGWSDSGNGAHGVASSGSGVYGLSTSGYGVYGLSASNAGVYGYSTSGYGVYGRGDTQGGVQGTSSSGIGVTGASSSNYGVFATSNTGIGLYAYSTSSYGVQGGTGSANNYAGYFIGSARGAYGKGSTYAVYADGPLYVNSSSATKIGGGTFSSPSDARVKKDVGEFGDGLAALEKVRPVRFKYNGLGGTEANGKEYVGVIAQELEAVAPYMVSASRKKLHDSDRDAVDVRQVDPSAFTYMLINAVKDLAKENRRLAEQNRELAAQTRQVAAQTTEIRHLVCAHRRADRLCGDKMALRR